MTNTVELYRTISWEELGELLVNGRVNRLFNREHPYTTYKKELGNVVCGFVHPRIYFEGRGSLTIQITVDRNSLVGEGVGTYETYDHYDSVLERIVLKEAYISDYTIDQVKILRYDKKTPMVEEIKMNIGMDVQESIIPQVIILAEYKDEEGIHLLCQYENEGTDVIEFAVTYNAPTPEFARKRKEFKVEVEDFEALMYS